MKNIFTLAVILYFFLPAQSQYMSRSQPVPFACPTVCPGSVITLEVFQVQSLNAGDTVQAWLSNASGSFGSGTTTLTPTAYSLNTGTTWMSGPYIYSSDVNNLYIQITIPANLPAGTGYTIKMKTSSGYVAGDLFSCSGSNYITVTSAYPVLGNLPITASNSNQWVGHVYTWVATTSASLFTTALVDSQDFYDPANYKGYFLKDSLSFDINWLTASGGTCPGTPGVLNDGTNIPCSEGFSTLYSIKFLRTQNFAPGSYKLSIQGDDGIRLSIDGGNTWLLSSFFEQEYANGYASTDSAYPNGICLSGATNLVIEYFQRNVDSHATFTCTQLSSTTVADAGNQSTCPGNNVNFNLGNSNGLTYQWYYSTNNGASFQVVPNTAPFSGANTANLGVSSVTDAENGYLFRCSVTGVCSSPINTPTDTLFIVNGGTQITISASKLSICPHNDSAVLCVPSIYSSYMWSTGATTACITTDTAGDYFVTTAYRTGCSFPSNHVQISVFPAITPTIHETGSILSTTMPGSSYQWYNSGNAVAGDTMASMTIEAIGTYYLTMLDTNGCPEQSNSIVTKITGLNELSAGATFSVYPNPASDKCVVLVNANPGNAPLLVYDELGQLVLQSMIISGSAEVSLRNLAAGIYLFKMGEEVRKVVKE